MTTGVQQIVAGLEAGQVSLVASVPDTWIGRLMEGVRRSARRRRSRSRAAPTWPAGAARC